MRPVVLIAIVAALLGGGLLWLVASSGGEGPAAEPTAVAPRTADEAPTGATTTTDTPVGPADTERSAALRSATGERTSSADERRDVEPTRKLVVRGRVVDDRGHGVGARLLFGPSPQASVEPLDAADRRAPLLEAVSDSSGAFRFELEPGPGRYGVAVRSPGFADLDRHGIALPAEGDLVLELPLERGVVVQGTVVDDLGKAVGGARILRGYEQRDGSLAPGGLLTLTGVRGEFALNTLPAGPLALVAEAPDYRRGEWRGLASAPGERVAGVVIELRRGGTVTGRVVDRDGRPAAAVTVVALERAPRGVDTGGDVLGEAESDAGGAFRLGGLPSDGAVHLRARAAEPERPARWLTHPLEAHPGDRDLTLVVERPAGAALRVVAGRDGASVVPDALVARATSGGDVVRVAEVELLREVEWAVDDDGRLRVLRLPWTSGAAGGVGELAVSIAAHVAGRTATSRPFQPAPGVVADLGELVLGAEGSVPVRVVDGATDEPVEGARVHLEPWAREGEEERLVEHDFGLAPAGSRTVATDGAGFARVPGPLGRECRLWAEHPERSPSADVGVTVQTEGDLVELRLAPATSAVAVVVDPSGRPLAGRTVLQTYERPGEGLPTSFRRARTDADGRARFAGLRPGGHRFALRHESEAGRRAFVRQNPGAANDGSVAVAIAAGGEVEVRLVAVPLVSLSGTVTRGGAPLAGATVRLYDDAQQALDAEAGFSAPSELETRSDGSGAYRLEGLAPQRYRVTVAHATLAMPQHFEVPVLELDTSSDLDLVVRSVVGRVTSPDGAPIAGARVSVERGPDEDAQELPDWMLATMQSAAGRRAAPMEVTTDADGRYAVVGVDRATALVVVVRGSGLVTTRSAPFGFQGDRTEVAVDLVAAAGGTLRVRIASGTGEVEGWQLLAHPLGTVPEGVGRRTSPPSGADGTLVLEGLHPARYRLELQRLLGASSVDPEPVEVDLAPGTEREVVFQVP